MSDHSPAVGRVVGTNPAGPLDYAVSIVEGQYLELDDVVMLTHDIPGVGTVDLFGIVADVRAHQDGVKGHYDVHDAAGGTLPTRPHLLAEILTTRIEPERFVPPQPGALVHRATGEDRFRALMLDDVADDRRLLAGIARTGGPMFIDADFFDGTNGAHVNISGVSGVATKTSYALFLLYSLLHKGSPVLGDDRKHARAVIFNVKGQDLLYLDKPNTKLTDDDRADWAEIGMEPGAFESVALWSPPNPQIRDHIQPASQRKMGVKAYWWSLVDFCAEGMLSLLFADADDERQQYAAVARHVEGLLKDDLFVKPLAGGGVSIEGHDIRTFRDFVDRICDLVDGDDQNNPWRPNAQGKGTIAAFQRRLWSAVEHVEHLIRGDSEDYRHHRPRIMDPDGLGGGEQLNVIDINPLSSRAQRFVVGATLRQEFAAKEASARRNPLLFVVLDELNKYAPRQGDSPIKATLKEIAERGRSLGIILIGAQQTASAVDESILTNASIKVAGRLDAAEATKDSYRWMPQTQRNRATLLKPGAMVLAQPKLPIPVVIGFPMPGWATRGDEAEMEAASTDDIKRKRVPKVDLG